MNNATLWWLVVGGLIGAELLSGTFYLLMLAAGGAAAAVAAHMGLPLTAQLVTASLVGGLAVTAWHVLRQRSVSDQQATDAAQHLDVGETIQVEAWDAQGTAQVKHRGAPWTAVAAPGTNPSPGLHRIAAVTGNRLVLEKI